MLMKRDEMCRRAKRRDYTLRVSNFPSRHARHGGDLALGPARQQAGLLKLLTSDPVKRFLVCVNQKELRFRVADPGARAGAAA